MAKKITLSDKMFKDLIDRFKEKKGFLGVILSTNDGLPVKSTLDTDITEEFTARMAYLLGKLDKFAKKLDGTKVVGLTVETENTEIILIKEDTTFMSVLLAK